MLKAFVPALMNLKALGNNFRSKFLEVPKMWTPDLEIPRTIGRAGPFLGVDGAAADGPGGLQAKVLWD